MTRQHEREAGGGAAGARSFPVLPTPLLLHVRTVADAPRVRPAAVASISAFDAQRAAVVLHHQPTGGDSGGVQLGLLTPAPKWTAISADVPPEAVPEDAAAWPLAWSPDGTFVVLGGGASLWLCTTRAWMADAAAGSHETGDGQLLLAHADLSKWLAAKELAGSSRVVAAFFTENKSNRLFLVLDGGLLVKVDVQVPKLALLALNSAATAGRETIAPSESDVKALLKMKVVKRLTDWHAGVIAAAFNASSATLVITGGLKNPSDELVRGRASSLSVWKMLPSEPFCELLDYTMVLNGDHSAGDGAERQSVPTGEAATVEDSASGLLESVKGSVFSPLKFIIGGDASTRVLHGSIRQLAVSPDGVYVAMVDTRGHISVRQIEACSDVIGWQAVDCSPGRASATDGHDDMAMSRVKSVVWLSASVLWFVLEDGHAVFSALKKGDFDASEQVQSEDAAPLTAPSSSTHVIEMLSGEAFVQNFPHGLEAGVRVEAISAATPRVPGVGSSTGALSGFQLVSAGERSVVQLFETTELATFVDLLTASHQFDRALEIVEAHGMVEVINLDLIHRQIWTQFRLVAVVDERDGYTLVATDSASGFAKALNHLSLIRDKSWVVSECLDAVASDSFRSMKDILETGLLALDGIANENDVSGQRQQLQRHIYRLETFKMVLAEDLVEEQVAESEDPLRVAEQCYDGAAFAQFRSASIVETAKQLAREGRVGSLAVLFQRNARTIIPRRLEVLSQLSASIPPFTYSHLLPAVGPDARDDGQLFYTLQPQSSFQEFDDPLNTSLGSISLESRVVGVELDADDTSHDLDAAHLAAFELSARQTDHERRQEYAQWFQARILEMDTLFGQLANAYQLSSLARECLRGDWRDSDAKNAFDGFQHDVERLYNCIYPLQLSSCCLLSLEEWAALSLHDQILHVIGDWDAATDAIDRVQAVFVAHRRDALYTLDDAFSSLCQTLSRKCSLSALEVCAQLIHHSNPAMPIVERWIQSDAQLLRTAMGVVYSATTQSYFHSADELVKNHRMFVEQLWTIFQSLPVRKAEELPEIEQLQVAVDEMEDLMVTMDVLSKYGVLSSPSELRDQVGAASSAASDLLQRMCEFSLPGKNGEEEDNAVDLETQQQQWMAVWHDAMKLKTHVFGERVSQEAILDGILRHLLSHDEYLDAAEHLATNWISTNVEVIHHVVVVLIRTVQTKMDTLKGNFVSESDVKTHLAALKCIDITKRVLSFPPPEHELERKTHFERQLRHEIELVHACQLLDLLSYGSMKLSPGAIRPLKDAHERLDILLEVFASNPSNYQPSKRARDWFTEHHLGHVLQAESTAKPLDAILYLSKLLRVEDQKHQIMMKGAYAALYCADYDVAYGLTTEVIKSLAPIKVDGESTERRRGRSGDVELQHLMSLVLDLISASSFQSWSKKLKLCRVTFSALNASMFSHQITNLILSRMEKLEAIEALAVELGLSEVNVEERRRQESNTKAGVEELLLKELEIVVELLQEEKNDRSFLLRLLQRGLQLACIVLNGALVQQTEDEEDLALELPASTEETQCAVRIVQQMTRVCFAEALAAASKDGEDGHALNTGTARLSSDWRACLEMGCSYLLLWSEFSGDECDLEAFWESEVLPLISESFAAASSSTVTDELDHFVRQLHHFFVLQVASTVHASETEGKSGSELALQLREGRKRIEEHTCSYEAARRFVASKSLEPEEAPESDDGWANGDGFGGDLWKAEQSRFVAQRGVFIRLAKRCQDTMLSQKKTQELEEMSSFFNADLDLERFSRDADYRVSRILLLASRKEHYQAAKQFAIKYGVDEYQCLLAYIKGALLAPPVTSVVSRHEQLELAFRTESEDFMEQALQQPFAFGWFLLNDTGDSVYESLDGTDHVGILLVLRMVLECSKRIGQLSDDELAAVQRGTEKASLFPLSKASSDRVTLLFMCLKRLKEVEPLKRLHHDDNDGDGEGVDFKTVCAAESCADLLRPPTPASASESRRTAVEAVLPFLNGKTIKLLTKILQKLHKVTASAVVMIYLSKMLRNIWREQRDRRTASDSVLAADLAVYAYESCTPFFSVVSNEHLLLFHCLFLGRRYGAALEINAAEEFYGQSMDGFAHYGGFLTPQKRVDVISETLGLFQTRFESWTMSSAGSEDDAVTMAAKQSELQFLESELAQAAIWYVADEVKRSAVVFSFAEASWQLWERRMQGWFSSSTGATDAQERQELFEMLVLLCQSVSSVDIASLLVELVLFASSSAESASVVLQQVYGRVFASFVETRLGSNHVDAERRIVAEWTSSFPDTHSAILEPFRDIASFITTLCASAPDMNSTRQLHSHIVAQLAQVSSATVKAIAALRSATAKEETHPAHVAVVAEWRHQSAQWDQEQKYASSAVLTRLVLDCGAVASIANDEELGAYKRGYFGLQTKAVFAHIRSSQSVGHVQGELDAVFAIPTARVFDTFDVVFTSAIALMSNATHDSKLRCSLTVALANLLWFHARTTTALCQSPGRELHSWEQEQSEALATRVRSQFGIGEQPLDAAQDAEEENDSQSSGWWSALMLQGAWSDDREFMKWYLTMAYGRIRTPRVLEDFAVAHWETRRRVCVELLLVSPFRKLHAHHQERLLSFASSPAVDSASSSARRVLELLLLRFDLQTLLHAGLYTKLMSVFLERDSSTSDELWTSSGKYAVCALVVLGEYASAGRLACALWQVHPLLWDAATARLTLANFLRSLAAEGDGADRQGAPLLRDVYAHASSAFQRNT